MRLKEIFIFVLFIIQSNAQTTDFIIKNLTIEDGLSQSTVYSIMEDKQGFMWFATEDGLNKYDGYQFTVFKNNSFEQNSLSENTVYSIDEGAPGILWISTWSSGLNKYDVQTDKFTRYVNDPNDSTTLSSNNIYSVVADLDGFIWVATEKGLNRLDTSTNTFRRFYHKPGKKTITGNFTYKLLLDQKGNIWAGGFDGLSMYNKEDDSFVNYIHVRNDPSTILHNEINALTADKINPDLIWVGSEDGAIEQINSKTGEVKHFGSGYNKNIPKESINAIETDINGQLWIGTTHSGLFLLNSDGKIISNFKYDKSKTNSISDNNIYSLYAGQSGIIWAGTSGSGINLIRRNIKKFKLYDQNSYSERNLLGNLIEDQNKNLWMCRYQNGISIFNRINNKIRSIKKNTINNKGLNSNNPRSIFELSDGKIAIGTEGGGLNIYNPQTDRFEYIKKIAGIKNSLFDDNVNSVVEDSNGILWLGFYYHGLDRWDRNKNIFKHFEHDEADSMSLSGNSIYTMFTDNESNLWIATERTGLSILNKKTEKFTRFFHNENDHKSLSNNDVMAIYQAMDGIMWFGTFGGGLNKFNSTDNTFKSYKEEDGLPNNVVYGILEDDHANLWLSTNKGISRFNPVSEEFRNYDVSDGLQSNEFNFSFCKTDDGEMFFGGVKGLNSFFPDEIEDNLSLPKTYMTNIKILNKDVQPGHEINGRVILNKHISFTKHVELEYSDYVVSFEFVALEYFNSQNNEYAYKLEGFDSEWNYSGNRRFATYSNLPSGSYTFLVKATNNDKIWNEQATSLKVIVIPPFWVTWWFRLIGVIFLVAILMAFIHNRISYIKKRNKTLSNEIQLRKIDETRVKQQNKHLEEVVNQKTIEMKNLMEKMLRQERLATIGRVSGSIAHELRNPLGAVKQSVYYLKTKIKDSGKIKTHLDLIDNELVVANKVIDDLLEIANIKSSEKKYMDIEPIIVEAVKGCLLPKKINVEINIEAEVKHIWIDPIQIRQVFVNLITNAYQSLDGDGTIKIHGYISRSSKIIQFDVSDNGRGISSDDIQKIFEPLFTTKATGTGLGLSICKEIIAKHDGRISVISRLNEGTTISIFLPADKG